MKAISTIGIFCVSAGLASAAIIFDNSSQLTFKVSDRDPGDSPITYVGTVASDTTISEIGVLNTFQFAGNLKFLIFDDTLGTLLYQSGPVAFGADTAETWKVSNPFTFTLHAGRKYDIGAIADVPTLWSFAFSGTTYTEGDLTSGPGNANASNYVSPILTSVGGDEVVGGDIRLRLYDAGTTGGGTPEVPEPATLGLIAGGFASLAVLGLRMR